VRPNYARRAPKVCLAPMADISVCKLPTRKQSSVSRIGRGRILQSTPYGLWTLLFDEAKLHAHPSGAT